LRSVIGDGVDVALLDVPNQTNVGDSLIWAGEVAYLKSMGLKVRYISDIFTFDPEELRRKMPTGVVLLHGGGNFGDLWIGHQRHREEIVSELTEYRIVQLPQSIYFESPERAAQADQVLGKHTDFHLLLRDELSIERAKAQLPSLHPVFCYDMALGYTPPASKRAPKGSLLIIARKDKEAQSGLAAVREDWIPGLAIRSTDWHSEGWLAAKYRFARKIMGLQRRLVRRHKRQRWVPTLPQWAVSRLIVALNEINIAGALGWYSMADLVVVDRLHAHVLALLLGMDHVVLDNNYRKIGAVFDGYTGQFSTANYVADIAAARSRVRQLAAT
jgi:pyruvyl transferase EpsO